MWRRNNKANQTVHSTELVLPSSEGVPWAAFPMSVIDPIRWFITRVGRKEEIPPRLSFVAALRREGVSYISWAFATTMAYDLETTVCIVDLNWWWPSDLSKKVTGSGGFGAVFAGETSLEDAVVQTGKPNLAVLPAGEIPLHTRAHFARSAMLKDFILELNDRYDHLILDIPAVLVSNDAIPLASLGTACCVVIQQGVTSIEEAKSAVNNLDHIPQLGVIMNKLRFATPDIVRKFINPY